MCFFVRKCIIGLLNVHKITYFLQILILFLLRYHRIVWSWECVGEWSKIFLPEADSSKSFWQLGCQVATLFAPLVTITNNMNTKNQKWCKEWIYSYCIRCPICTKWINNDCKNSVTPRDRNSGFWSVRALLPAHDVHIQAANQRPHGR